MWVMVNWLLCTGTMISLVFGLYWTFHGYPMRLSGNILYGSLSHVLWAVALSWVVYTCWHCYAGKYGNFFVKNTDAIFFNDHHEKPFRTIITEREKSIV